MERTTLTPCQLAAVMLTQATEPMPRGIIMATRETARVQFAFMPIEPGSRFPDDLATALSRMRGPDRLQLLVVNDAALEAAQEDAGVALGQLGDFRIDSTVLVAGGAMLDTDNLIFGDLAATIESLPDTYRTELTALRIWAVTRQAQFDPVESAPVYSGDDLLDRWEHTLVTGEVPTAAFTAQLGTLASLPAGSPTLLIHAARLAFPSLDESTSDADAVHALLRGTEVPSQTVLLHGGLALCFAGAHTVTGTEAAWLYASGALLLWAAGRSRSAMVAAETALMHDDMAALAVMAFVVISTREVPDWMRP